MYIKAKKSLGQNFLKSEVALKKICEAGEINNQDVILEIGPGKGALTKKLLEKAGFVFAVEKDRDLVEFLKEKFSKEIIEKKLILIEGDILQLPITNYQLLKNYKLISNIPYNITGAILKKFLTEKFQPEKMVLLVQKEVAERIVSRDNKESILSLSIKAYGTPKYIMKVSKRFFSPSPKVDSAVISISNISRNNFSNENEEEKFFELIKNAFLHKRKVAIKNIEKIKTKEGSGFKKIFADLKINEKSRPEDISFDFWLKISKFIG